MNDTICRQSDNSIPQALTGAYNARMSEHFIIFADFNSNRRDAFVN